MAAHSIPAGRKHGIDGASLKRWAWVHRWSSLVCTVFLLLLCLTGLPLVFSDEIGHWLDDTPASSAAPGTPRTSMDTMVARSLQQYPGQQVYSLVVEDDARVKVFMAPSFEEARRNPRSIHVLHFDAYSGAFAKPPDPTERGRLTFMNLMLKLHTDLFAGLAGELLLGFMGLLFVIALVSGVVLYAPFMRKLPFGVLRRERSRRLLWLDWHNLLGIATLCWLLVVGVTGVINELATPMFAAWRGNELRALLAQDLRDARPLPVSELPSVQQALDSAMAAQPGMQAVSVVYPGNPQGSSQHYLIWAKGRTPLTSQLYTPTLVDGRSGALLGQVHMPWYLVGLQLSRPLHFGDYAGLPLKILWAVLDLIAIVVLVSGVYLWWVRRPQAARP